MNLYNLRIRCNYLMFIYLILRRNDPISHVREAALIALEEIGGEEANEAVRVTKLLTSEMDELNSYFPFENVL